MQTSAKFFDLLRNLLLQLPSFLTILGCLVAAIVRWKRHPGVSLPVVIALLLLFLLSLAFPFFFLFVPDLIVKPGDFEATRTVLTIIGFFYNSFWGIALVLLLAAIFRQREMPPSPAENSDNAYGMR